MNQVVQADIQTHHIIDLVNTLIIDAVSRSASDIHFEPTEHDLRIRIRIDGILYEQNPVDKSYMLLVISRIKVLGRVNIAEKRIPQDGKFFQRIDNRLIDFRISTFPSLFGEKIVMRILDRSTHTLVLEQLGFYDEMLKDIKRLLGVSHGLLLVTGPTGSGKTTTLYAFLSSLLSSEKNIITLEDPVEYNLDGIIQGQVNPEAGFTFEKGIRALLRQDPDILMVGEIRDKQTARIAIEAALTGHLVLSTLHTNNAISAVMRLMDMGIEPFLINASVVGVLAQRLVKRLCRSCTIKKEPKDEEIFLIERFNFTGKDLFVSSGCHTCQQRGFKGRIGIFELLQMNQSLRSLIVADPLFDKLYACAYEQGMQTLEHDAAKKVTDGHISLDEFARIVL